MARGRLTGCMFEKPNGTRYCPRVTGPSGCRSCDWFCSSRPLMCSFHLLKRALCVIWFRVCRCQAPGFPEFLPGFPQRPHLGAGPVRCECSGGAEAPPPNALTVLHCKHLTAVMAIDVRQAQWSFSCLCLFRHSDVNPCFACVVVVFFLLHSLAHQDSYSSSSSSLIEFWEDVSVC